MLVFFDDCVNFDIFCGDESELLNVYGINHSLVFFGACASMGRKEQTSCSMELQQQLIKTNLETCL